MAAVTICSDFGAPQNKVFHCFPIYFPWSDGTGCHDLCFLNVELWANFFTLHLDFNQEAFEFLFTFCHKGGIICISEVIVCIICICITMHGQKYHGDGDILWSFPTSLCKLGVNSLSKGEEEPLLPIVLRQQQLVTNSTFCWIFAGLSIDQKQNGNWRMILPFLCLLLRSSSTHFPAPLQPGMWDACAHVACSFHLGQKHYVDCAVSVESHSI